MKKHFKFIVFALFVAVSLALCVAANAESGYVVAVGGGETNIKWELSDDGNGGLALSFEIDPSATDKKQTTVLYGANATTGAIAGYNTSATLAWGPHMAQITKVSIGDGITEINGGICTSFRALAYVEIPKSLTVIKGNSFQGCDKLTSVYYRGNEIVNGEADISSITSLGNYIFDNCRLINSFKLSESFSGAFGAELFKYTAIKEFKIPANVTRIGDRSFIYCGALERLWCYSKEYTLAEDAFNNCGKLTYVYGYAGTPLEEYCRKKDISFRNIDNPDEYIYKSTKEPEIFDPTSATAYGQLIDYWQGSETTNTFWCFYEETKTLKFFSNRTGWNETGQPATKNEKGETTEVWMPYKDLIERVVIGKGIVKVSQKAFKGLTSLKTVELGANVGQIDMEAFQGCSSLTTIYRAGSEPVEGTADLTHISKISDNCYTGTALEHFILDASIKETGKNWYPNTIASITCTPNDDFISFGVEYYCDIIDVASGETVSKNYVFVDRTLPSCGNKTVFDFDESTGTLTVSGVGPMGDIVNYYGGGSKNQWWFDIKQQIKKVVIEDGIGYIGKYAFAQCKNIEYVELPSKAIEIGNAAFESCENLKSVYVRGNEPVIGHLDLSLVPELTSWCFSKCYLIANVSINENVGKIGTSVFDTCPNLSGVYGVVGSYAESFAAENGYKFADASKEKPVDTICEAVIETTASGDVTELPETTAFTEETESVSSDALETDAPGGVIFVIDEGNETNTPWGIIIIITVAALVLATVVVIVAKKKK